MQQSTHTLANNPCQGQLLASIDRPSVNGHVQQGRQMHTFSLVSLHTASPSQGCRKVPASTTSSGGPASCCCPKEQLHSQGHLRLPAVSSSHLRAADRPESSPHLPAALPPPRPTPKRPPRPPPHLCRNHRPCPQSSASTATKASASPASPLHGLLLVPAGLHSTMHLDLY